MSVARVRFTAPAGLWPFDGWTADRLLRVLCLTPHTACPITGRLLLRPAVGWASRDEWRMLDGTPTRGHWPLGIAVLWHRVLSRMERAYCPQPWHVIGVDDDAYGASRDWALIQLGGIGTSGRTGVIHA